MSRIGRQPITVPANVQVTFEDDNVILVKGEVVFEGSSDELLSKPELLEQYLGV